MLCLHVNDWHPAEAQLRMPKVTQQLGMVTRQTAEVETNMNAVERVVHYKDLPQEAAYEVSKTEPPLTWPAQGQINFYQVVIGKDPRS